MMALWNENILFSFSLSLSFYLSLCVENHVKFSKIHDFPLDLEFFTHEIFLIIILSGREDKFRWYEWPLGLQRYEKWKK